MTRVGRYELQDQLGQGGMGMVFRAHDTVLNRMVALKILRGDRAEDIERLFREARIAAKLKHEHIVAVHDVGSADRQHYIAMELVEGVSLEDAKLPVRDALDVIRRAAEAVQHAHDQGVIHRDLKPGNILLGPDGRPKVTDFGMAKQEAGQSSLSAEGAIVGTPNYMSPEQASGRAREADARSDVWSLGATLYHLIAGRPPYEGEEAMDVVLKILQTNPDPLPKVHRDIQTIVMKCLERNPRNRYRTASELAADLGRYLDGEPILARPVRWWVRRKKTIAIVGLLAVAVLTWDQIRSRREESVRRQASLEDRRRREEADAAARSQLEEAARYRELHELLRELDALTREHRPYLHVPGAIVDPTPLRRLVRELEAKADRFEPYLDYWRALGSALAFLDRPKEAEAALHRALAIRPDDPPTHYQLGRLCMDRAMWAALYEHDFVHKPESQRWSTEALSHLSSMGPVADLDREICRAFQAFSGGRLGEVVEICTQGISRHGREIGVEDLWMLRGFVEKPIENFRKAAELKPNSWWPHCTLGMAFVSFRRYDDAMRSLTKSYELNPKAETLAIRGGVRGQTGDYEGGVRDLEEAMRLDPTLALTWYNRGVLRLQRNDVEGALADFTHATRIRPTYGQAWYGRAKLRATQGRFDLAIQDGEQALKYVPHKTETLLTLAYARIQTGDYDGAIADTTEVLQYEENSQAYNTRGGCYSYQKKWAQAEADFTEAIRLNPRDPVPWTNRAETRYYGGRVADSIDDFTQALALHPNLHRSRLLRAAAWGELGRRDLAVPELRELLRTAPADWPLRAEAERVLKVLDR